MAGRQAGSNERGAAHDNSNKLALVSPAERLIIQMRFCYYYYFNNNLLGACVWFLLSPTRCCRWNNKGTRASCTDWKRLQSCFNLDCVRCGGRQWENGVRPGRKKFTACGKHTADARRPPQSILWSSCAMNIHDEQHNFQEIIIFSHYRILSSFLSSVSSSVTNWWERK